MYLIVSKTVTEIHKTKYDKIKTKCVQDKICLKMCFTSLAIFSDLVIFANFVIDLSNPKLCYFIVVFFFFFCKLNKED